MPVVRPGLRLPVPGIIREDHWHGLWTWDGDYRIKREMPAQYQTLSRELPVRRPALALRFLVDVDPEVERDLRPVAVSRNEPEAGGC